jgi:F0F1-type ATP synthase membrane subunit b/b'
MVLDPLAQIDPTTIGAVIVIFLVTLAVLRRVCFVPLLDAMERRDVHIEAARARRAQADALLAEARLEAERILESARAEAGRVGGAAREERARERAARLAEATSVAAGALAHGHEEVAALRRSEQAQLAEELCACARQVLSRTVGAVDEKKLRFLVTRTLAAREIR